MYLRGDLATPGREPEKLPARVILFSFEVEAEEELEEVELLFVKTPGELLDLFFLGGAESWACPEPAGLGSFALDTLPDFGLWFADVAAGGVLLWSTVGVTW